MPPHLPSPAFHFSFACAVRWTNNNKSKQIFFIPRFLLRNSHGSVAPIAAPFFFIFLFFSLFFLFRLRIRRHVNDNSLAPHPWRRECRPRISICFFFLGWSAVCTGFYLVLPSFPGLNWLSMDSAGFERVFIGFRWFYWVFTEFPKVVRDFTGFYRVSLCFDRFYLVAIGCTGFYRISSGFTGFYWVLQVFSR